MRKKDKKIVKRELSDFLGLKEFEIKITNQNNLKVNNKKIGRISVVYYEGENEEFANFSYQPNVVIFRDVKI